MTRRQERKRRKDNKEKNIHIFISFAFPAWSFQRILMPEGEEVEEEEENLDAGGICDKVF